MVEHALDDPIGQPPLREKLRELKKLKKNPKILMAFDDVSIPLPPMRAPDIRKIILEQAERRCMEEGIDMADIKFVVGMHMLNSVDTWLASPWFQPLNLKCDMSWFQSFCFQIQLVPLRRVLHRFTSLHPAGRVPPRVRRQAVRQVPSSRSDDQLQRRGFGAQRGYRHHGGWRESLGVQRLRRG
jgi:hypothetical protein